MLISSSPLFYRAVTRLLARYDYRRDNHAVIALYAGPSCSSSRESGGRALAVKISALRKVGARSDRGDERQGVRSGAYIAGTRRQPGSRPCGAGALARPPAGNRSDMEVLDAMQVG